MFLERIIQFCKRVWNGFINLFTFKKSESSVVSTNHSASSVMSNQSEPDYILYQEFGSICDNVHELSQSMFKNLDFSKFDFSSPVIKDSFKLDLASITDRLQELPYKEYALEASMKPYDIMKHFQLDNALLTKYYNFNTDTKLHKLAFQTPMSDNDVEIMKQLLEMRINPSDKQSTKMWNPNMLDCDGFTPLHIAISRENLPAIKLLLSYGADLFTKSKDDDTLYELTLKSDLIQDLFRSDLEVNKNVREQQYSYNINKLFKIPNIKSMIGNAITYKSISNLDGPVNTLKVLSVEIILKARHTIK